MSTFTGAIIDELRQGELGRIENGFTIVESAPVSRDAWRALATIRALVPYHPQLDALLAHREKVRREEKAHAEFLERLRKRILSDPDDEPMACGGF